MLHSRRGFLVGVGIGAVRRARWLRVNYNTNDNQRFRAAWYSSRHSVLWDHPELQRLWVKLTATNTTSGRARAVDQKLEDT